MKLSKWIVLEGHCATRVIHGTNPNVVENRVAFIEKTPRVLLDGEWVYGRKGRGGAGDAESQQIYGFYPPSRQWCDDQLRAAGFTLTEE